MAGVTYLSLVWEHLQKYGTISHNGIIRLTGCNCPYDVIRKIKDRFGADAIDFRDIPTKKKVYIDGKEIVRTGRFRRFILNQKYKGVGVNV